MVADCMRRHRMRTGRPAIEDPKAYKISARLTVSELGLIGDRAL